MIKIHCMHEQNSQRLNENAFKRRLSKMHANGARERWLSNSEHLLAREIAVIRPLLWVEKEKFIQTAKAISQEREKSKLLSKREYLRCQLARFSLGS